MNLEDYKEIVASCATIFTMIHMLSGVLICRDIHKKGSTRGFDPMPFLGGIGMSILMLQYAWILKDPAMISVNVFGLVTNTLYMAVYYYYSPETKDTLALIGKMTVFVAALVLYAQIEHPEKIEFRFGIITTVLLLLLIGSPLIHLGEVIRTKSTEILPFPLIFMATIVTFSWLLYGFIIGNVFTIFQNLVGFILSLAQMSLFVIYPSKSKSSAKSSTSVKKEN